MSSARQFWVGSYTPSMGGTSEGIGAVVVNDSGTLDFAGVAATVSSPSFLANSVVPDVIYATVESSGRVEAFLRTAGTTLEALGGQDTSGGVGASPCHISVTAERLYVANYGSGAVDVFPVLADGRIGPLETSFAGSGNGPHPAQAGPHAHATVVIESTAAGSTILSADLGSDQIHVHRWVDGKLRRVSSASLPPGTGPRDFTVSPDGRIFVLGELSGAILEIDEDGRMLRLGPAVGSPVTGDHLAALAIDAEGRYLYTGLRGSNRIAVVDSRTLTPIAELSCGGDWPRHLVLSGDFLQVANEHSSTIASFRIDAATGIPVQLGQPTPVPTPTYLLPVA
jgi:6-phosphogluconolactonase (cycloisomerase 2 family)